MKKREREEKTEQKRRNTVIKEQTNSGRNKKTKRNVPEIPTQKNE